ncbi:MAG: hypothetical protein ABFD83_06720 [Armatimonadota bacterium]
MFDYVFIAAQNYLYTHYVLVSTVCQGQEGHFAVIICILAQKPNAHYLKTIIVYRKMTLPANLNLLQPDLPGMNRYGELLHSVLRHAYDRQGELTP